MHKHKYFLKEKKSKRRRKDERKGGPAWPPPLWISAWLDDYCAFRKAKCARQGVHWRPMRGVNGDIERKTEPWRKMIRGKGTSLLNETKCPIEVLTYFKPQSYPVS